VFKRNDSSRLVSTHLNALPLRAHCKTRGMEAANSNQLSESFLLRSVKFGRRMSASGTTRLRMKSSGTYQFGHVPNILGGSCEKEAVPGTILVLRVGTQSSLKILAP
jgi:hypothetical protein